MRVLAFTRYGAEAASTRQRLLQYLPALADAGIEVAWHPLLDDSYVRGLVNGHRPAPAAVATAYAARLRQLASAGTIDAIWIYAELFPYLPSIFERLAFTRNVPVVYDFDDAFFHQYDDAARAPLRLLLSGKLRPLMRGATVCACGNAYLRAYADKFCDRTVLLPTVVDTDTYLPAPGHLDTPPTIGWIGTPSTWQYVRPVLPLLARLAAGRGVRFRAVGAGEAAERDRFDGLDLVAWREDSEIAEVQRFDIGIMPLPDARWARGKSGYKLVQYMACGIPVIASPVGVNVEIVEAGGNGLLATTEEEWSAALVRLIDDPTLRKNFGARGRERVVERYSLRAMAPVMVDLLRSTAT